MGIKRTVLIDLARAEALFDAGKYAELVAYLRGMLARDTSHRLVYSEGWKKMATGKIGQYLTAIKGGEYSAKL